VKIILSVLLCVVLCLGLCACNKYGTSHATPGAGASSSEPAVNTSVIMDTEHVRQTIISHGRDLNNDYTIRTRVTNKTDNTLYISWLPCMVNGWMFHCGNMETLEPDATVEVDFIMSEFDLGTCRIRTADELVFRIIVNDISEGHSTLLSDDFYTCYPTGLSTNRIIYPEQGYQTNQFALLGDEGLTVTVEDVGFDSHYGYYFACYFANNTDRTVELALNSILLDRCDIDFYGISMPMLPGSQYREQVVIDRSILERLGITEPGEVTLAVHASDYDTQELLADQYYSIYPTGLTADQITPPSLSAIENGTTVMDNEYISLAITGCTVDMWGYYFDTFIVNHSDQTISLEVDKITADGMYFDSFWADCLPPGGRAASTIVATGSVQPFEADEYRLEVKLYAGEDIREAVVSEWVEYGA